MPFLCPGKFYSMQPSYTLFKTHPFHSLLVFLKKYGQQARRELNIPPSEKPVRYPKGYGEVKAVGIQGGGGRRKTG